MVKDGSSARLECLISGDPKPNIAWFKESSLIAASEDFLQFYDDDNQCSLVIREVYPEDTGKYTVVAKNPSGVATSSADLVIEEGKTAIDDFEMMTEEKDVIIMIMSQH